MDDFAVGVVGQTGGQARELWAPSTQLRANVGGPAGGTLNTPDWASVRPPKTKRAHSIDGATHAGAARPSPENKKSSRTGKTPKKFGVRALGLLSVYDNDE